MSPFAKRIHNHTHKHKMETPDATTMPIAQCRIIGLSGKIGSGKTTFARYIQLMFDTIERHSFAENLRRMTSIFLNIPVERLRSPEDKETMTSMEKTVGVILQEMGTEVCRQIHPDAWVLSLFAAYEPGTSYWVIDDVRFKNEADYIKKLGGIVIRLNGDPGSVRKSSTRNLNHWSETVLDDYDRFDAIINTEDHRDDMAGILSEINTLITQ